MRHATRHATPLAYMQYIGCFRTHQPSQAVRIRPAGDEVGFGMRSQIGGRDHLALRTRLPAARGLVRMNATGGIASGAVVDVRLPENVQEAERSESEGCSQGAAEGEAGTTQMVIQVPLSGGARQLTRDVEEPLSKSLGRLRVTLDKAANKGKPKQRGKKKVATSDADSAPVVPPPPPLRCLLSDLRPLPAPLRLLAAGLIGTEPAHVENG